MEQSPPSHQSRNICNTDASGHIESTKWQKISENGKHSITGLDALDGFVGGHPLRLSVQYLRHLRRVGEIRLRTNPTGQ